MSAAAAAGVCAAAVVVLKVSSEEMRHMTIIYSGTAPLRLHGSSTAARASEVAVYLEENNSYVNLPKGKIRLLLSAR